jgi:hypothetical protein
MDLSKLFDSIEKLIYNFLLLVLFLPKTLFKLLIPKWSYSYVENQFKLSEEDRFQDHISPMLLFIILVTIPVYFSMRYGTYLGPLDTNRDDFISVIVLNKDISFGDKFVVISLLFNTYPILFAILLLWMQKIAITKQSFKKPYYHFLYTFCTIYSAFLFFVSQIFVSGSVGELKFYVGLLWFIYAIVSACITNITIFRNTVSGSKRLIILLVMMLSFLMIVPYFYILVKIAETLLANFID